MKHFVFTSIVLFTFSQISKGQSFIDSCFTSVQPSTNFVNSSSVANMSSIQADMLEWNGSAWIGGWPNAGVTIPPPTNQIGCKAVFLGSATSWTTGGEGFGVKINTPLVAGQTYSFDFTYISHGNGSNGSFSPAFHTNSIPSLVGYFVGNLPPVGGTWTTNTYTFTATVDQIGHEWLILTTAPNGSTGLVNSFCSSCNNIAIPCNINLGSDQILCDGDSLILDVPISNATFLWQDGSTDSTFTVSQAGSYFVTATYNNCIVSDTVNVSFNPSPMVNLGNDTTLCNFNNFLLDAATPSATYLWQNNSTSPIFTVTQPGTYWVTVTASNNCASSDTININSSILFSNIGNDTTLCTGQNLLLDASIANATYSWHDNSTNPTFLVSQAGTYWVTTNQNNCSITDSIVVNYNSIPTINLGNDTSLCNVPSYILNATANNATYVWQDNSSNPTLNATQTGEYWVVVSSNNCVNTDTIYLTFTSISPINLGNDTSFCTLNNFILDATTTNASYIWQDNSVNATYNVTQAGTYWAIATINGCSSSDTIVINSYSLPDQALGNDTTLCEGDQLLLNATISNATYLWQDNSTLATFTVTESGTYWVSTNLYNCLSSDTILIEYSDCNITLEMPNIFTPNNDGTNNHFMPIKINGIKNAELKIYSRWGILIFETSDLNVGWDGSNNGKPSNTGTYFYTIDYTTVNDESKELSGFVTLMK